MSAGREIERKFLVKSEEWRRKARPGSAIVQGYLARGRKAGVRVRIRDDKTATITIKSREAGASRDEYEYRIPLKDGLALLELCGKTRLEKQRFEVPQGKLRWEVDVFGGRHEGLVLAEIELSDEATRVRLPDWIGEEVTSDPRYRNASLASVK